MNDDDKEFEIGLSKVGMRFGARIAVAVGLFATGITVLITTPDLLVQHIDAQFLTARWDAGAILIGGAGIIWFASQYWTGKEIDKLKKSS